MRAAAFAERCVAEGVAGPRSQWRPPWQVLTGMLDAPQRNNRAFQASRTADTHSGRGRMPFGPLSGKYRVKALSQSADNSAAPNNPTLMTPADTRLAPGGQQPSWDFLDCLTGLLNSKEMLHMFKKCVSIWDAQGLAQKSSEPALQRKGSKRNSQTSSAARRAYEAP